MARPNRHRDAVNAADALQAEFDRLLGPTLPRINELSPGQFTVQTLAAMRGLSRARAAELLKELLDRGKVKMVGKMRRPGGAPVYEIA